MAKWHWPKLSPETKAWFRYFGRGFYVVLGIAVVAGLIILALILGNRNQEEVATNTAPTTSRHSASTNHSTSSSTSSGGNQSTSGNQSTGEGSGSSTSSRSQPGPTSVPNTGPGDWAAPLAAVAIAVLLRTYLKTRRQANMLA